MSRPIPPGAHAELVYTVTPDKTVPSTYREFAEFADMPAVFATGLMVTLMEACCQRAILPYLDWPREMSVGTQVNFDHLAATPPGLTVRVRAEVVAVQGRKISFRAEAHDGVDLIARGTHERHVIDAARFNARVADKLARVSGGGAVS
jgi:fluoroacetyl-CoA thioesterase